MRSLAKKITNSKSFKIPLLLHWFMYELIGVSLLLYALSVFMTIVGWILVIFYSESDLLVLCSIILFIASSIISIKGMEKINDRMKKK